MKRAKNDMQESRSQFVNDMRIAIGLYLSALLLIILDMVTGALDGDGTCAFMALCAAVILSLDAMAAKAKELRIRRAITSYLTFLKGKEVFYGQVL